VKGDFSRVTFNELNHYRRVLQQQGRVEIDADGNEQIAIDRHVDATTTTDVIGQSGYPQGNLPSGQPAGGFSLGISATGSDLTISPGRMYVDGLLVENDTADASLLNQPDMPGVVLADFGATESGIYGVYLDVWERLITALDNPLIQETALGGPDTSVRTKMVWQVKLGFLEATPASGATLPTCASAGDPWVAAAASTGMLAASSAVPTADLPCVLTPDTGYQLLENQLYRVEIHDPGPDETATFKWSRENGSVVCLISTPPSTGGSAPPTTVTGPTFWVTSLSDDPTLGLQQGDYVELTDDSIELIQGAGTLYQVAATPTDGHTVTLNTASTPTVTLALHPKLRRWDQSGTGLTADGCVLVTTAAPIPLEGGLQVQFSPGTYQVGDYWLIPARAATSVTQGFVQWPVDASSNPIPAPPLGIVHHYATLGLVELAAPDTFTGLGTATTPTDCRLPFLPLTALNQSSCPCTITVQPGPDWEQPILTYLQSPSAQQPVTVCFDPGTYTLSAPLVLGPELGGITFQACSSGVVLQAPSDPGAEFTLGLIVAQGATSVTIQGIELSVPLVGFSPPSGSFSGLPEANQELLQTFSAGLQVAIGISVADITGLVIEDCTFAFPDPGQANVFGAAVYATGAMDGVTITGCTFQSANAPETTPFYDLTAGNQTQPPYQLTFGYLQVSTFPQESSSATGLTAAAATSPDTTVLQMAAARAATAGSDATLGNIGAAGATAVDETALSAALAAAGAADSTSQLLHDAAIGRCLFQGITVPAFAMTQLGTLRADQNTVRNSYGGFWLYSVTDSSQLTIFDVIAVGNPQIFQALNGIGAAALAERTVAIATAIVRVLPSTPPSNGTAAAGTIFAPSAVQLARAGQTLSTLYTQASASGGVTGTPSSAPANVAPAAAASTAAEPADAAPEDALSALPPDIGIVFNPVGIGSPVPAIPVADPGTSVSLRFDLCDCQVDAVIADSYSGAGLLLADLTQSAVASALVHGSRLRTRFPGGETFLGAWLAEASISGNIVANEVPVPAEPTDTMPASYSLALLAMATPLGAPALIISGNVLIDPPIPATGDGRELLNTIIVYSVVPSVTGISPASGPAAGGTSVTITGTGFTAATGVSFGSTSAAALTVNSDVQITATSPAGSGTVDITVTTPAGTSTTSSADQFSYFEAGVAEPAPPPAAPVAAETAPAETAPAETAPAEAAPDQAETASNSDTSKTQRIQSPSRATPPRLVVTNSADAGRSFDLRSGAQVIGRDESSDIKLEDNRVSHNHAVVRVRGSNATIEDLNSTNGTQVNGAAIEGRTALEPGDEISVGGVRLLVERQEPATS
jgi:hypothetical protein